MNLKEKLSIPRFDGVFGIADSADLPSGIAYYAENIDFVTRDGSFVGFPKDELYGGASVAYSDEIVLYNDGLTATLYNNSTGTFRVISFSHSGKTVTEVMSANLGASLQTSMVSSGQAVHMGLGGTSSTKSKRIGVHYHPQFGVLATSTPNIENAELSSHAAGWVRTSLSSASDVVFFLPDNKHNGGFDRYARFDNTQARFRVNVDYTWYASLVYDGNQEAPLQKIIKIDFRDAGAFMYNGDPDQPLGTGLNIRHEIKLVSPAGTTHSNLGTGNLSSSTAWRNAFGANAGQVSEAALGIKEVQFYLRVRTTDNSGGSLKTVSRRVSGVKIYRSESFSEDGKLIEAEPTFISYYDLNTKSGSYTWTPRNVTTTQTEYFDTKGIYQELLIVDDGLPGVYTFEQSTDYASSLSHMEINYGLSCMSGGYHIIGKSWHKDLEDINTWVFRSKPYRYDTYDWVNEYLVLPSVPTALVAYRGGVFAFTKGRIYVINPSIFDIEETWEGAGVEHEKSVVVTESGMFWASNTGIYHYDSARVNNISSPILRLLRPKAPGASGGEQESLGWLDRNNVVPVVTYSPVHDSLVVFYGVGEGAKQEFPGLLYHVPSKRWVPISDMGVEVKNAHVNDDGDIIVGLANNTFKRLFTDANRRKWRFVSRNLGEHGSVYKYFHAYVGTSIKSNPPTVFYYLNDPLYKNRIPAQRTENYEVHSNLFKYEITESVGLGVTTWASTRDFAIELVGTSENNDATEITLIRKRHSPR